MVQGLEFSATSEAAFHPSSQQIAGGEKIREGPTD